LRCLDTVVLLLGISFIVAFAIGGNDEAMSPAVGARTFSLNTAVVVGGLLSIAGALTLGWRVSDTIGSDLVSRQTMTPAMVLAVLLSMAVWLLIVSTTKGLPISTTQCMVGSVIGVALSAPLFGELGWGFEAISWSVVLEIFSGWIISPIIGFLIAAGVFQVVRKVQARAMGFTGREKQEQVASYGLALFLIITSLSRGGNDVANAVAPLISLPDFEAAIVIGPVLLPGTLIPLFIGGLGMAVGLMIVGRKVIKVLATEVVTLTPSSALAASVSVALVTFVGTYIGLPLSGTHLLVAALIAVGWVAQAPVRTNQVRNIVISWVETWMTKWLQDIFEDNSGIS
jgi:phosphate/sulfate permease